MIAVDLALPADRVTTLLDALGQMTPLPAALVCDHGLEFTSQAFDHQAENVTQEYGWQESERILEDAEVKLQVLLGGRKGGGQMGGPESGKPRKSNAPRRTRTPSLLIRSQASSEHTRRNIAA
jgi:hypothetical protein